MSTRPTPPRPDLKPAAPPGAAAGRPDDAAAPPTGAVLPTPRTDEQGTAIAPLRAPLETIALAMKTQVDLLRQMQDRQRALEDAVRDEKRHELVINSAQALNDAFRGMQQSQDRLAERLDGETSGPAARMRRVGVLAALLVVAAALAALVVIFRRGADDLGSVARRLESSQVDAEARAAMADLEARVRGVEATDRQAFQAEFERLRRAVEDGAAERDALRKERDQAREDLGALRGRTAEGERQVAELRAKLEASDKEVARLTTQTVGDQRLIAQMNNTLEALRTRAAAPAPGPATPVDAPPPAVPEAARDGAVPSAAATDPGPESAPAPSPDEAARAAAEARDLPFTPGQREDLNRLLGKHRGRQTYVVVAASKIVDKTLKNVVLEVRGADGSRDKTVEAESMTVKISPRGEMVDLDFTKGSIVFHSSVAGRDAKSPFFNDRYQLVLLGAPTKEWLASGLSFVSMR